MEPISIVVAIVAAGVGFGANQTLNKKKIGSVEEKASKKMKTAKEEADKALETAKKEAEAIKDAAKKEEADQKKEINKLEERIRGREESLESKIDELDKRSEKLRTSEDEIGKLKTKVIEIRDKQQEKLEKVAKLKKKDAEEKLLKMTENDIKEDLKGLIDKLQNEAAKDAEVNAQLVLLTAMERMSADVTAERTVTAIKLEDEDMKGRIIGKEGRNIQAFQRETGVDVLVDDTPGMVVLSSFDPIRRQVARLAMEKLLKDGRVHPARIEEVAIKAREELDKEIEKEAEDACREVGIVGVPSEIMRYLGELKFRTSYGQNVLKHSVEMAHMAAMIAEEIGADVTITKTAALLHDFGKALSHKMEGKHHHIGGDLARKYGMSEEFGPIALETRGGITVTGERYDDRDYSEKVGDKIDEEVRKLIDEGKESARGVVIKHRKVLDIIAKRLIEVENLERDEYEQILIAESVDYEKAMFIVSHPELFSAFDLEIGLQRHYITNVVPSLSHVIGYTGIINQEEYEERKLIIQDIDRTIVQMCTKKAEHIKPFLKILRQKFPTLDEVNFNMGCPQSSLQKELCAGGILQDTERMKEFCEEFSAGCKEYNFTPSIKLRVGVDRGENNIDEYIKIIKDANINKAYVHARTLRQGYNRPADHDTLKNIKDITLIINGDITDFDTFKKATEKIKCDGVMIGRQAIKDPKVFKKIKTKNNAKLSDEERISNIKEFLELASELPIDIVKKNISWLSMDMVGGRHLRKKTNQAKTVDEMKELI